MGCSLFANWIKNTKLSAKTKEAYLMDFEKFSKWFAKSNDNLEIKPDLISSADISEFIHQMSKKHSPRTVNRYKSAIKKYLSLALVNGEIEKIPILPDNIRFQKYSPKAFNKSQQLALLRTVERSQNIRDTVIIHFGLKTGLRVSECTKIKVKNIIINDRSGFVDVMGKGMAQRLVPLSSDLRKLLKEYIKTYSLSDNNYLFNGQRGPLGVRALQKIAKKYYYLARLNNEDFCFHTLRHTFAMNLINKNTDLVKIATLLGHSDLSSVMIYTYPSLEDLQNIIDN